MIVTREGTNTNFVGDKYILSRQQELLLIQFFLVMIYVF